MLSLFSHVKRLFSRKRTIRGREIDPSDILLDATNLPEFNTARFEGRFEQPITKRSFLVLGIFCALFCLVMLGKVWHLQVVHGEAYAQRSERNRLHYSVIFPERGVIYDRNGIELAWNSSTHNSSSTTSTTSVSVASLSSLNRPQNEYSSRAYTGLSGFAHVLGYVSLPKKDKAGFFYKTSIEGVTGAESAFDSVLAGTQGLKIVETDVHGEQQSEGILEEPVHGKNITLSIDSRVQTALNGYIQSLVEQVGFEGGGGVIMDVLTGEIISLASYPEFDSEKLSNNDNVAIRSYESDPHKPYLNRALGGVYTPGSIIKPFVAAGVLNEHIINPEKKIESTGRLLVPNKYDPSKPSVFVDWQAQGWVDLRHAIAVSSDIYFYEVGGGFGDQKGLGIANIEKYARMFGFGSTTGIMLPGEVSGVIPSPAWKEKNFTDGMWRLGDTYNTSIGQYGFQVTVLQAARATAAVANGGTLLTPRLMKGSDSSADGTATKLPLKDSDLQIIREGMLLGVKEGTAKGLANAYVSIGAKTGTAQVGINNERVHSWVIGFFPYDHPRYAFAVMMEKGPLHNPLGGVYIMRQLLDWMHVNTPEYFEEK